MELERDVLVSPTGEVPVIEGELVTAIRDVGGSRGRARRRLPARSASRVNTVRRYLRQSDRRRGGQIRPAARRLTDDRRTGPDALRRARRPAMRSSCSGCWPSAGSRSACGRWSARSPTFAARSAWPQLATVRVETAPGDQLQIDFGQKRLLIAGVRVRIFLLVAVLSYSRRLFVKAFLNERGDDWREGIAAALHAFRRTCRGRCSATMRARWCSAATARPGR